MEAVEARKNVKPANDLILALGIKDLQQHFLKHREFFTEQEIKDYFQNFQKFDVDKDGKISATDITRIATKMGEKVDKNKISQLMHPKKPTESITFDDFLDIMRDVHHGTIPSDKGFAHLYFRGKDLIKFPSEFRLKEISPTFHSTTSDELCVLMCFINMMLKDDSLTQEGIIPIDCKQIVDLKKLCDGRVFCHLLNTLQDGLVPMGKFCDKADLKNEEMTENQTLCLAGAAKYGCDVKDIEAMDLVHGVEYRLLALLSQIHQVAKHKKENLDRQIEDFAKQRKEERERAQPQEERPQAQQFKGGKPRKARGERRRQWRQKTGMKKKMAKEVSKWESGMDPEEFFVGWCNFHLKKFNREVSNLGVDFVDGMNFLYLMNALNSNVVPQDFMNQAKRLSFDEADRRGEMVLEAAKNIGVKMDVTPVDVVKGDFLINFAFVNQLYNLFAASTQNVQDIIKMQNECLGYMAKNINDLEDLEMLMEEEIGTLRDNVENLEDSLAGLVGELLVDELAAMTGMPIPAMGMQALTPAEEVFEDEEEEEEEEEEDPMMMMLQQMIPQAPPLPGLLSQGRGLPAGRNVRVMNLTEPQEFNQTVKQAEAMEQSLQSQMMDLMNQVKQLMEAQKEQAIPAPPPIPATIKSEVQQATTRQAEIKAPEKEGLAYMKGVLKWKPCRLLVQDNRLFVFKAGKEKACEDIYLSEAIKLTQEPTTHGYFGLRLSLSFTDCVILGWTDEFIMRDWLAFLTTKVRPIINRTEFVMSGQRMVPQSSMKYQLVQSPAASSIPTGNEFLEAVQGGDIPTVRNMLERGADPLVKNNWGGNCLHVAAAYGNKDMTKWLTDYLESKDLIKFLLDQPTSFDRNTPLHLAIKSGDPKLCQMLLEKGANKELKNIDNENACELANSRGILDVMAIFSPPAAPPPPAMPHSHPFLIRGAPMANYRPQMTASQSPYLLPSSSPYYRYRNQPF